MTLYAGIFSASVRSITLWPSRSELLHQNLSSATANRQMLPCAPSDSVELGCLFVVERRTCIRESHVWSSSWIKGIHGFRFGGGTRRNINRFVYKFCVRVEVDRSPAIGFEMKCSHRIDELLRIHAYAGLGITLFATSHHVRALGILEAIANSGFADAYFFLAFGFIRLVKMAVVYFGTLTSEHSPKWVFVAGYEKASWSRKCLLQSLLFGEV